MPAFTFEKISSPPTEVGAVAKAPSKQVARSRAGGLISHMIDRLTVARLRRSDAPDFAPPRRPPD
jgi:hypothetical protein